MNNRRGFEVIEDADLVPVFYALHMFEVSAEIEPELINHRRRRHFSCSIEIILVRKSSQIKFRAGCSNETVKRFLFICKDQTRQKE